MRTETMTGRSSRGRQIERRNTVQRLAKGETDLERGDYLAAESEAKYILQSDPNHLGALELLARAQWRNGEFEAGLDVLRHLIRLNPYEPGYHYLRGSALQSLGHYGEAVRAYSRCLESDSESLRRSAATSICELEGWQETVIAGMLQTDSQFKTDYAIDPQAACQRRGFAFASTDAAISAKLAAVSPQAVIAWDRPC